MRIHFYSLHGLFRGNKLEIGRDADNGGQIVYVMELAKALSQAPQVEHVHLFTRKIQDPAYSDDYAQTVEKINDKFDIRRIECGGNEYLPKEHLWPYLDEYITNTIKHIKEEDIFPNWMHSHYADSGYVAVELSAYLNVPFSHSAHSLGKRKLKKILQGGLTRKEAIERYKFIQRFEAEEQTLANAEFIVTSTDQEVARFNDYENKHLSEYHTIPPGIDFKKFYPYYEDLLPAADKTETAKQALMMAKEKMATFLSDVSKPLILSICRPDRTKNIEGLIEAYGTDPELRSVANLAIFAGIRSDIEQMPVTEKEVLTKMLILMDKYDLYGKFAIPKKHDTDNEVPEIYRLAAFQKGVFVNIALNEHFGLTILEASSCGLPVVATKNGGPSEIIPHLKNGFLVDPLDKAGLQKALKDVLLNKERWQELSNTGISNIQNHYSWQVHIEKYLELVESNLKASQHIGLKLKGKAPVLHSRLKSARKMLALDIDGTLISETNDSQPGLEKLRKRLEQRDDDFVFALATGRSLKLVKQILHEHNIPVPDIVISSVGTEIYYGFNSNFMDKGWIQHINYGWDRDQIEKLAMSVQSLTLQEEPNQKPFKISFYINSDQFNVDELHNALGPLLQHVNTIVTKNLYVDILPKRASKGRAIRYISQKWSIPMKGIIVGGDSGNDLDMFQTSALGIVVGNYAKELEVLRNNKDVYFSKKESAEAILDGLSHFNF